MKWHIPSKTFLLGEYAALAGASAFILTTTPYFTLTLNAADTLHKIHPDSPAGVWWRRAGLANYNLSWEDPYQNKGGLGASSAQFLGAYWASCYLKQQSWDLDAMLEAYYQSAWSGMGLRPSGYDVIAQSQQGCVYINKQKKIMQSYPWPFKELSFLVLHTGEKLATHHHLEATTLPQIDLLSAIVDKAKEAFEQVNQEQLIQAVNEYHQELTALNLVAARTQHLISRLKNYPEILAIKGCGALGADTLLILSAKDTLQALAERLRSQGWLLLATDKDINR